jgi:ketopantoate reductase
MDMTNRAEVEGIINATLIDLEKQNALTQEFKEKFPYEYAYRLSVTILENYNGEMN